MGFGDFSYLSSLESPEKICNISCQPIYLVGVKANGNDVNPGIKHSVVISPIPGLTSLPPAVTPKKSTKMTFSADKIYYKFSQEIPKMTNM